MARTCPECGARFQNGDCRDAFDTLQAREWGVDGGVGEATHFLAISAYAIQHPASLGYSKAGVASLERALVAHLREGESIESVRDHLQRTYDGSRRIRGDGNRAARRSPDPWPTTVRDVLEADPTDDLDAYREAVERWARSVVDALE